MEQELRWTKEAAAIAEAREQGHFGSKMLEMQVERMLFEYQHLCELDTSVLNKRIERLEQDLRHAKNGWDKDE